MKNNGAIRVCRCLRYREAEGSRFERGHVVKAYFTFDVRRAMSESHVRGINDKVLEEFREHVKRKCGKKHTVMGLEVICAFNNSSAQTTVWQKRQLMMLFSVFALFRRFFILLSTQIG